LTEAWSGSSIFWWPGQIWRLETKLRQTGAAEVMTEGTSVENGRR
jgi:hypothetical protein